MWRLGLKALMLKGKSGRRSLLQAASSGAAFWAFPTIGHGASLTKIDVLNDAAIQVRDPAHCFLAAITRAGGRLVAVGDHGVILHSDDEGVTWRQASVPVSVPLTSVGFFSPSLGWAAGNFGVILNTTDGGDSWHLQLNGFQANQLTMAAAQIAVSQKSTLPGVAFALKRANAFMQGGADKPFLTVLALSAKEILVFGAYRMTMLTTDGGNTWQDWSLHVEDRLSHNLYSAIIVGSNIYVVGETGVAFCSADGGNRFSQLASPSDATLFGVVAAVDGSIVVFGVAGSSFRSIDGGKTWLPTGIDTQDNLTAGRRLDSGAILIASEAGALYLSKDNGTNFTAMANVPPTGIFDFEIAGDGDLILVGNLGVTRLPLAILNG
jgi:photosystem II stability/assembly factor-like uncharacterized protein